MKIMEKIIEYGIYLFVFILPWQTRLILSEGNLNGYWEYGTISIYATEILLWAIFLLGTVRWIIKKLKFQNSLPGKDESQVQKSKSAYLLISLFTFLLYSFISIFWSEARSVALQALVRLAEGIGLFLVLRIAKIAWIKIAWAFVAGALIQAGLGIWQFLTQSAFECKWLGMAMHDPIEPGTYVVETGIRRWLRAYGSLPHPNMLAGFLAVAMFFSFWLYQKTGYGFKKLFLPIIFSFLSLGFLTAFSKSAAVGALAALVVGWAIVFIRRQSGEIRIDLLKFTLVFLAIAAIFSVIFWEPVSTRIYGQDRLEIKSTEERLSYFSEAWQIIKKSPILGVGIGNYTLAVHNEINPGLQSWDYQPVHNIYLLILAELGAIGFLLWLALMVLVIKTVPITCYPLLAAFAIIGFFDHYLWTLCFGILFFWLFFSMADGCHNTLDESLDKQ